MATTAGFAHWPEVALCRFEGVPRCPATSPCHLDDATAGPIDLDARYPNEISSPACPSHFESGKRCDELPEPRGRGAQTRRRSPRGERCYRGTGNGSGAARRRLGGRCESSLERPQASGDRDRAGRQRTRPIISCPSWRQFAGSRSSRALSRTTDDVSWSSLPAGLVISRPHVKLASAIASNRPKLEWHKA